MKNKSFYQLTTALIAILSTIAMNSFAQLPDVLICGSPDDATWNDDVKSKLDATGQFNSVSIFNIATGTPSLSQLQDYDAVLLYTDAPGCSNCNLLGDNLAAYIDGGGGVVAAVFATASIPIGGAFDTESYQVIIPAGQTDETQTLGTIWKPNHPIMNGVTSFNGGTSSYRSTSSTLAPGGYRIADWSDGTFLITAKENVGPLNVSRVDLGFFPPSIDARDDFWVTSTDGALIMANALTYVSACPVPTNLSVSNITASSAKLTWDAAIGAGGYKVRYKVSGTSTWTITSSIDNVKNISTLAPETEYAWQVKSICGIGPIGSSDWSVKQFFTTNSLKSAGEIAAATWEVYPNPFTSATTIEFSIMNSSTIKIDLFDLQGRKIKTIEEVNFEAGNHLLQFGRENLPSGSYLLQLKAGSGITTKKLLIE